MLPSGAKVVPEGTKGESGQRPLITVMLLLLMNPTASSRNKPEADSRKLIAFASVCSDFFPPTGIYWLSLTYDSYCAHSA